MSTEDNKRREVTKKIRHSIAFSAALRLQQESADVLSVWSGMIYPSQTMFRCATGGCQPYLCGSGTPRRRIDELLTVVHQSPVDVDTPEVNTSVPYFICPSCFVGVYVSERGKRRKCASRYFAICKTKTQGRMEHSNLTLLPRHRDVRSQYRLGNVVRCYREALACLEGVEGCNH